MPRNARLHGLSLVSLLTLFALLVHGYHPYAEDGGLYVAGIRKLLNPSLYPHWTEFVTEHLHFSLFAPLVATLARLTHLPLPWLLFVLYAASLWTTLYAAWILAAHCIPTLAGRSGAVVLLACWLTLPIAGTSLMLMDPYVTARSLSTPLTLFALAFALQALRRSGPKFTPRAWTPCVLSLLAAAAMHPLMAGYALAAVILLASPPGQRPSIRRWSLRYPWILGTLALALAASLQFLAPPESRHYIRVAMTRYYWFPARWQWFEQIGLLAPLAVLLALLRRQTTPPGRNLARMALQLALIALAVALAFSRPSLATHLVARMQPLRCFQIVYVVMILLLGAWLGDRLLQARPWRWLTLLLVLGGTMFFVQRATYPASAHLELPWRYPPNPWQQAFLWARDQTPNNALFALDAHYITRQGEDAQCFRAIAQRSALPDYSKDGGEASITPSLTEAWIVGQTVQTGLDQATDAQRRTRLKPLGVDWIILEQASPTQWACPYTNSTVKICRLH